MRNSQYRIEVSHVGSLPRTDALLKANRTRRSGPPEAFERTLADAVTDVVARQKDVGVTIPDDGEYGKSMTHSIDYVAFLSYAFRRLGGLEIRRGGLDIMPARKSTPGHVRLTNFLGRRERNMFRDAYSDPTAGIVLGEKPAGAFPVATGPITYTGHAQVQADIANLKAAMQAAGFEEGFIPAISPGVVSRIGNEYYQSDEELVYACADAMREEYRAIVDAGLILQIDDSSLAENYDQIDPEPSIEDYRAFATIRVDALNHALEGIPAERVRYHLCWGSWHGPHTTDIELRHIIDLMLRVNAQGYTFEAANARHAHEWKIWNDVKLPEGKIILPGVVTHATNTVEHPELVADRIERFANIVGRENVIACTDCGLGGRVHPQIAWAKLKALSEGAKLASQRLWK